MSAIVCPKTTQVCFACEKPCAPLFPNALATDVPKEEPPFRGILATVLKVADVVSVETNLDDEAKLNLNIKL